MNKKIGWILTIIIFIGFISCFDDDGQKSCNPEYVVSTSININLPLYSQVENVGWTYVGGEGTGTMGIILVKTTSGYKAFDRNAPHICPMPNSRLEVIDDIKIFCPYDEAEWILQTGQPISIADRPPRTYTAVRTGDIVNIYN